MKQRLMARPRLTGIGVAAALLMLVSGAFFLFEGGIGVSAQSANGKEPPAGTTSAPVDTGLVFSQDQTTGATVAVCGLLAGGKVTAINGTQLTVQSKDGGSLTIDVTGATTYERAGVKSSLAAIHVGDLIAVQGTRSGNTIHATAIHIIPAMVAGTVTKVSGSNITISGFGGATRTVITSGSTTYAQPDAAKADGSAVKVGAHILAQGTLSSDGKTLNAERILILPAGLPDGPRFRGRLRFHGPGGGMDIFPAPSSGTISAPSDFGATFAPAQVTGSSGAMCEPLAAGKVTAIHGNQLTLQARDGTSLTVNVTSSTTYERAGTKSSLSAIHVGDYVAVQGTRSGSTIQATAIHIVVLPAGAPGAPGFKGAFRFPGLNGGPRFFGDRGLGAWQFRWNGSEIPAPGQNI